MHEIIIKSDDNIYTSHTFTHNIDARMQFQDTVKNYQKLGYIIEDKQTIESDCSIILIYNLVSDSGRYLGIKLIEEYS